MYYEGGNFTRKGYAYTKLIKPIPIKHGSFGGPGLETDNLYAAGSDDFQGYVWKIPPIPVLEEQRKVFSGNEWESYQSASEVGELLNFSLVSTYFVS